MNPVPFFPQERPESCVPACLRMVLACYGLECTAVEIYTCCETDADGTLPSAAVRCALTLGFDASAPRLSGLNALREQLETLHVFPIVYVNLSPILGINVIHALIVEAIGAVGGGLVLPAVNQQPVVHPAAGRHRQAHVGGGEEGEAASTGVESGITLPAGGDAPSRAGLLTRGIFCTGRVKARQEKLSAGYWNGEV